MKLYSENFGWWSLDLPKDRISIQEKTPQSAFVRSHFSDIKKECSALKAILKDLDNPPKTICDLLAGSGFSATVFRSVLGKYVNLRLNDLDSLCVENLKRNFPNDVVSQEDLKNIETPLNDLTFVDFNNFTLKKASEWKDVLERLSQKCSKLVLTDSASYGFCMGNLKAYNVNTLTDYFDKLSETLSLTGKHFTRWCSFGHATLVLFEIVKRPRKKLIPIEFRLDRVMHDGLL